MNLRPYKVQLHRYAPVPDVGLERVDRLNLEELLDSLHYPVVWCYDHYLQSWLPGEIDHATVRWLESNPRDPAGREQLLLTAGLVDPGGRHWWEELRASYVRDGAVRITKLLSAEYARWMGEHYRRNSHLQRRWRDMPGISRTSINDHPLVRLLHSQMLNLVSYVVAEPLKPSYSFTASYDSSSNLPAHRDRPQCVYNISLMFGGVPSTADLKTWPLHVKTGEVTRLFGLDEGDGALYSGIRDLHWRDKMPGELREVAGSFLHYVPANFNGPLT